MTGGKAQLKDKPPVFIRPGEGGTVLSIYVQPRASQTEIAGVHGESLKIRVASPPVDGKANTELLKFLKKTLAVSKSSLTIISGEKGRKKQVLCRNIEVRQACRKLLPS